MLEGLNPDRTLLFDVPVAQGMARAGKRSSPDRIEREAQAFFERVRQCYLERAAAEPERFRVIDAGADLDAVRAQLETHLQEMLRWR
ncbi:Thymidylate kinase [Alcanivorax sp. ALC70]|nr:Thymidylate kinase [Alcanivorax sp. ALC70]